MVISWWISGGSRGTRVGSSRRLTSRTRAASKFASTASNEIDRCASSRRDRGGSISEAICRIERTSSVSIRPRSGLDVSRIGLGAMSMSGYYNIGAGSDAESVRTIHRALDLGVTHLDTAEIYGPYRNEELVGPASKDRRERAVLAPKFGSASNSATGPG